VCRRLASDDEISASAFLELCSEAIQSGRAVELRNRTVAALESPVKVGSGETLVIEGPGRITGSGHSVFQVGGSAKPYGLLIRNVEVKHLASTDRSEKRSLGSCLFARGKGSIVLEDCAVTSEAGFALWLVQKSSATMARCSIRDTGRSAITVFNHATLRASECLISNVTPHGVCARGETSIQLVDTTFDGCDARAVYAYMSCDLEMTRCVVTGTRDASAAAVQVEALRPEDASILKIDSTTLKGNAGRGLSIVGNVERRFSGTNDFQGPIDETPAAIERWSPEGPI